MAEIAKHGPKHEGGNPYKNIGEEDAKPEVASGTAEDRCSTEEHVSSVGRETTVASGEGGRVVGPLANSVQVGGDHYKVKGAVRCPHCQKYIEHWDFAWSAQWDFFMYSITKYLFRWRFKNGIQDLKKAAHYLQKYIELEEAARK